MSLRVILRQTARAEFDEAGDWYEQRRQGLGARFATAVQRVFDHISVQPLMHGVVLRDIRKAIVRGFPYCVYYRVRPGSIVVLSVFHTSGDPSVWQVRS